MRGLGEFLVSQGVWSSNPLRWLRGPKIDARSRVPRRIGSEQMEQLWAEAAGQHFVYQALRRQAPLALACFSEVSRPSRRSSV